MRFKKISISSVDFLPWKSLIIESGKTIRLTKRSAIANENKNQFVLVCNCLSSDIDTHTSKLPSVPNIADIDNINIGQFRSFVSDESNSFVKFVIDVKFS